MTNKLIVIVMGPGKKHFTEMCLKSVKDADKILYWTNIDEEIIPIIDNPKIKHYYNGWNELDPATNGKCRQRYLDYLKQNYPDDWALVLDEDEILDDGGIEKIKRFISEREPGLYNVKMRHLIGNLGWEDATSPVHVVPARLFKISKAIKYPEHSHPVLEGEIMGACLDTTIFHLGHLPVEYLDYIQRRYNQHLNDSQIHTKEFLKWWYYSHIFGKYPVREINPVDLPKILLERYNINPDEFYFEKRGLEVKHFIMVRQWKNYFDNKDVLDCGCGRGPYLCAWNMYDVEAFGFDISKYAVMNPINANTQMWIDNITNFTITKQFDLVTAIDILEHLEYEDLDKALENIKNATKKNALFSIPFIGDPNLEADSTHIIREDKEWWINKISKYFTIKNTPKDWLFSNQLLIGEKKC